MGPHGEREKISDPGEIRTHNLRNRSPLLYQLSYKARAGREKLRWWFAANEHVREGVSG